MSHSEVVSTREERRGDRARKPSPADDPRGSVRRYRTRRGWRFIDRGTIVTEVLCSPGPTHTIFDILAASCLLVPHARDIALLGFGGGSVLAALRALGSRGQVHAVDLDPEPWNLLRGATSGWLRPVQWRRADAVHWLRKSRRPFDVLIEDLSVGPGSGVIKPRETWTDLPGLMADRLRPGGLAVVNLLRREAWDWRESIQIVAAPFREVLLVTSDDHENRVLLAGDTWRDARRVGRQIRDALRRLGSRQATKVRVRTWGLRPPQPAPGAILNGAPSGARAGFRTSFRLRPGH